MSVAMTNGGNIGTSTVTGYHMDQRGKLSPTDEAGIAPRPPPSRRA
ncbi:hypothetical protein [Streptomyces sp. NPDC101234]